MNTINWQPGYYKRALTAFSFLISFILSSMLFAPTALLADQSVTEAPDNIKGHWAYTQIQNGLASGWMSGYPDGSFKPDQTITRAEFTSLVNRAAGYRASKAVSFTDVSTSDWFADDVGKAVAAGYISGYSDNSFKAGNPINRQEAATILAKVAKLDTSKGSAIKFKDADEIGGWSVAAVAVISDQGFMTGYPDGTFKPTRALSRAEALVCLGKVIPNSQSSVFNKGGIYGPDSGTQVLNGNVTINCSGVVLQNTMINGDLLLAAGIGEGEATLKNVSVTGNTIVKGGGNHSVVMENSTLPNLTVEKDSVRIEAIGKTSVKVVQLNSGAALIEVSVTGPGFENVTLSQTISPNATVTLTGDFNQVNLEAPANVSIGGGKVSALNIADTAQNSSIVIDANAGVNTVTLNAPVNISGQGSIALANINVSGSKIVQTPGSTQYSNGATGTVGGITSGTSTTGAGNNTGNGTGGGEGDNPLSLVTSDPVNGATGVSANPTIKLTFDRGVVRDNWSNNQNCITMTTNSGSPVAVTVSRIADNEDEKRNIYITPNSSLTQGETYRVIMSSSLMANNGNKLGSERSISFTVAPMAGGGGGGGPVTGTITIADSDGQAGLNAKAPNGPPDGASSNQNIMAFKLTASAAENVIIGAGNKMVLAISNINGLLNTDLANIELNTDPNGDGSSADGAQIGTGTMGDITAGAASITFNIATAQTINAGSYMNYIVQLDTSANWSNADTFSFAANCISVNATGAASSNTVTVAGAITARNFVNPVAIVTASKTDNSALALTEANLNGAVIRLAVANDTFTGTEAAGDFQLNNAPAGLSIASVAPVAGNTQADLTMAFAGDFDANITNFSITAKASGLTAAMALTTSDILLTTNAVGKLTIGKGDGNSSLNAKSPYGPVDGANTNKNVVSFKLTADAVENIIIPTGNNITVAVTNISGLSDGDLLNLELWTDNATADGTPDTKIATGTMSAIAGGTSLITFNVTTAQTIAAGNFMNYIIQLDTTANWGNGDTFTFDLTCVSLVTATGSTSNESVTVTGNIGQARAFINPVLMPSIAASNSDDSALALTETTLNGAIIKITLSNDTFKTTLGISDTSLNNAPTGLTIGAVVRQSSTVALVTLAFDGTDFDTNYTSFSFKVKNTGLTDSPSGINTGVTTITAVVE